MAVGLSPPENILPVRGVQLATTAAGIKNDQQPDLVLMQFDPGTVCAGLFTRNAFCAAPVTVAKQHLQRAGTRALLINSGNANAGTGSKGLSDAERCCALAADAIDCDREQVLPFSTGVIGEYLPMDRIETAIGQLPGRCTGDAWLEAAAAIMTTDTVPKAVSRSLRIGSSDVTITGIAKGAGMIRPDMATMLAFLATDACIDRGWLQQALAAAVDASFNCISVDGDTSTNDACLLAATGAAANPVLNGDGSESRLFQQALDDVCLQLAQSIVRDGEGATKFVTVSVGGAANTDEARAVAYAVAHSPLVKTALFASDPNWGRVLAAVGRAGITDLAIEAVAIYLDDVCIVAGGGRHPDYREAMGQAVMQQDEITIHITLDRGDAQATVWTTDLSYDYVRINAEYRT